MKEIRNVICVKSKEVVTKPAGVSQLLYTPEERVRVGEWILIPDKGLGHITERKVMCGKYIWMNIRIHEPPLIAHEIYTEEYQVWMNTWDIILSWQDRWESIKECILRRSFVLTEPTNV